MFMGTKPNYSSLTIGRMTAGVEFGRPIRPKWSGTTTLILQVVVEEINWMHQCRVNGQHVCFANKIGVVYVVDFHEDALELVSSFWLWWQFGYNSCFISNHLLVYLRLILGFAG